jgi:hypothetical protein
MWWRTGLVSRPGSAGVVRGGVVRAYHSVCRTPHSRLRAGIEQRHLLLDQVP